MSASECQRCGLPNTRRSVIFYDSGVCSVCRDHELKHRSIDWDARRQELDGIVSQVRGRGVYDAVVGFGGGKDGTYVLYYLTRVLGLRCLAVTIDNRFLRPHAWENCEKVVDELGIDQVIYRPPLSLVRRLMRAGLGLGGTVCWHCNAAIAAFPVRTAVDMRIPLVVSSHSLKENYSYPGRTYADSNDTDAIDDEWYQHVTGVSFERMAAALPDVDPRSLRPFAFPNKSEISAARVRGLFLSNYVLWDEAYNAKVLSKELNWSGAPQEGVPAGREYEKFDCFLVGTNDYLRFIKEGYGRGARIGASEVRFGRMNRQQARELAQTSDGQRPASLSSVLDMLELDEEEFLDQATAHVAPGRDFDVEAVTRGTPLPDAGRMRTGVAASRIDKERP
jgi:N-acetyl sugar amidotransferase